MSSSHRATASSNASRLARASSRRDEDIAALPAFAEQDRMHDVCCERLKAPQQARRYHLGAGGVLVTAG